MKRRIRGSEEEVQDGNPQQGLAGCGKTMLTRYNFDGPHVWENRRILPQDSRARLAGSARCEGSRSEVRSFRNPEPRTPNFGSRFSRMSRASRATACGTCGLFQHPAKEDGSQIGAGSHPRRSDSDPDFFLLADRKETTHGASRLVLITGDKHLAHGAGVILGFLSCRKALRPYLPPHARTHALTQQIRHRNPQRLRQSHQGAQRRVILTQLQPGYERARQAHIHGELLLRQTTAGSESLELSTETLGCAHGTLAGC